MGMAADSVVREYQVRHFDVGATFASGQNIRARIREDGRWSVASGTRIATIWQDSPGEVLVESPARDARYWRRFLAVDDDYDRVLSMLGELGNDAMDAALSRFGGVRVLHQDPFEAFVTSIVTQNNNIPRIRACVERLCSHGLRDGRMPQDGLAPFPDAERLLVILGAGGRGLGLGYRLPYLQGVCEAWLDGEFDEMARKSEARMPFSEDEGESCEEDMRALLEHRGIGPKVASCCCLFGLAHASAVPRDVWIRRFEERYDMPWVPEIAGIQQQYIFEWMREGSAARHS